MNEKDPELGAIDHDASPSSESESYDMTHVDHMVVGSTSTKAERAEDELSLAESDLVSNDERLPTDEKHSGGSGKKGKETDSYSNGYANGYTNGYNNGFANGTGQRPRYVNGNGKERADSMSSSKRNSAFSHKLSKEKTGQDVIVDFDGPDDPYKPINWPMGKKVMTTLIYGFTTMGATFASSVYSSGVNEIGQEFGMGKEVVYLGLTFLLLGFGFGPLLWAPLSELYGRKIVCLTPYFLAMCFTFGSATAKDIQTLLITRFFTGVFGAAPVTNNGGILADIWTPEQRGVAIVGYSIAVAGGPALGPVVGGAICQSSLGWRWTEYVTGIFMAVVLTLGVFYIEETYPPVLLVYKARRLRYETGNWSLHARHEEWDVSLKDMAHKYLIRPIQMLVTPICFLVSLYSAFVYGILYANLDAIPIEFQEVRGWNQLVGALPFLALLVGIFIGAITNLFNQRYYRKRFVANGNRVVPEARLPPMMIGGVIFAGGLFVFGWTSDPSIHWIGGMVACAMVGFGFFVIFQACMNYTVDTFLQYSASAIAANTFMRSCFAGAFPLFISPMYHNIGVDWGSTVFGIFGVALIPIPFLFFFYGKNIRRKGTWSRGSVND